MLSTRTAQRGFPAVVIAAGMLFALVATAPTHAQARIDDGASVSVATPPLSGIASVADLDPSDAAAIRAGIARWRGRSCPPTGCPAPSPARATDIAAFGSVVFATAWLARRRASDAG